MEEPVPLPKHTYWQKLFFVYETFLSIVLWCPVLFWMSLFSRAAAVFDLKATFNVMAVIQQFVADVYKAAIARGRVLAGRTYLIFLIDAFDLVGQFVAYANPFVEDMEKNRMLPEKAGWVTLAHYIYVAYHSLEFFLLIK